MGIKHKTPFSIGLIPNANFASLLAVKKLAIAAIVASLIFFYGANHVRASSGGIMGGSDWDSPSDSSSSDDSSSYAYSSSYQSSSWNPPSDSSSYQSSSCGSSSFSYCDNHEPYSQRSDSSVRAFWGFTFAAGMMIIVVFVNNKNSQKTSVIKLQVGLCGNIRPLQNDLNQIARTADTSTRGGMRSVLTGTLESLIAHSKSYISAYSLLKISSGIDEGKKMFNQFLQHELGKFDEETLVNVNNVRRERTENTILAEAGDMNLVITILVAAQGRHEVSSINTCEELIQALQELLSIPESKIRAVRVLWTPQQELDALSNEQLLENYPLLKPFKDNLN